MGRDEKGTGVAGTTLELDQTRNARWIIIIIIKIKNKNAQEDEENEAAWVRIENLDTAFNRHPHRH